MAEPVATKLVVAPDALDAPEPRGGDPIPERWLRV